MNLNVETLQITPQFVSTPAFIIGKNGKIIAWNKAMTIATGIPIKSVLSKKSWVIFLPRRKQTPADEVLKDGESRREEFKFLFGKEEQTVWFVADPIIERDSVVGAFVQFEAFDVKETNEIVKTVPIEIEKEVIKKVEIIKEVDVFVEVIKEVQVETNNLERKEATAEEATKVDELVLLTLKPNTGLEGIYRSNDDGLHQIQSIATASEKLAAAILEQSAVTEELSRNGDYAVVKNKEIVHSTDFLEPEVSNLLEKVTNLSALMTKLQSNS